MERGESNDYVLFGIFFGGVSGVVDQNDVCVLRVTHAKILMNSIIWLDKLIYN